MSRQHMFIALLVASATILGGILALTPSSSVAFGEARVANNEYVLMTARALDNGDDSVIVMETRSGRILTYQLHTDASGLNRLLLAVPLDLTKYPKAK